MLSSLHIDVVQNIANSVNKIIDGLQFDYSKLALDLGEILKIFLVRILKMKSVK